MRHYVLAACRPWYDGMAERLEKATGGIFHKVSTPEQLSALELHKLCPRYIFVPHWSWILPESIWGDFETVIFHMTDLPFGRGGSPLQNLISRGFMETKITALRCEAELDAGPVYIKSPLSLLGNAEEIFLRASTLMEAMIVSIIHDNPVPVPQNGEPVVFARRSPLDGNLAGAQTLTLVYDTIRMLDAEGYPPAFLETGSIRLELKRAVLRYGKIEADVTITIIEEPKGA